VAAALEQHRPPKLRTGAKVTALHVNPSASDVRGGGGGDRRPELALFRGDQGGAPPPGRSKHPASLLVGQLIRRPEGLGNGSGQVGRNLDCEVAAQARILAAGHMQPIPPRYSPHPRRPTTTTAGDQERQFFPLGHIGRTARPFSGSALRRNRRRCCRWSRSCCPTATWPQLASRRSVVATKRRCCQTLKTSIHPCANSGWRIQITWQNNLRRPTGPAGLPRLGHLQAVKARPPGPRWSRKAWIHPVARRRWR